MPTALPANQAPPPQKPPRLMDALEKYQSDSDVEELRAALSSYHNSQEEIKDTLDAEIEQYQEMVTRSLRTFTFFPSRTYLQDISVPEIQSDAEAIASYWEKVGEYLSYGIIQHILSDEKHS